MNNEVVGHMAEMAHEMNRAYCSAIGDDSQLPWRKATEGQRESCLMGVRTHLANPNMTPEQSHISWLNHKKENGWCWGGVKDEEKREHPCMVNYNQLPQEQRVKDYLFATTITQLKRVYGYD